MSLVHVKNQTEFNNLINGEKLVVVDFYATWCGPCKVIAPKFEGFSNTYKNATFVKVDVDEAADVAAFAAVRAMPTFQFYKKGQKLDEVVGADPSKLESKIKTFIA